MQKAVAILLLFALSLQCFSELNVLAGYELNKSYIAKVLCVNRDKPAMHCNGKCYLKKKMQQDRQRKNSENGTTGNKLDTVLFCPVEHALLAPGLLSASFIFSPVKTSDYPSPCFSFFHPPRA